MLGHSCIYRLDTKHVKNQYRRDREIMDTSQLENIAENLIASKLQHHKILVAKPKFDVLGTDLLAFTEMKDAIKFCRVQSKGRSLVKSKSSNIKIPKKYVTNGFLVFLYLEINTNIQELYIFFPHDIRQWSLSPKDEYQLSISRSNFSKKMEYHKFESSKVQRIKALIQDAEIHGEFRALALGRAILTGKGTLSVKGTS